MGFSGGIIVKMKGEKNAMIMTVGGIQEGVFVTKSFVFLDISIPTVPLNGGCY